jgi:hypothetical protein
MFNSQSHANVIDQINTIDAPVKSRALATTKALNAIAVKKAADLIEIAKRRSRLMSAANLFADPAWFMMLDLFVRQHSGLQTTVSSACHASFSPVTTALRHLAILTGRNIIEREYDPVDQRRVFVKLTQEASAEIQRTLLSDDYTHLAVAS